jgi:hypothetical protein
LLKLFGQKQNIFEFRFTSNPGISEYLDVAVCLRIPTQYTTTNIMQKKKQDQPPVYSNHFYAERGTRPVTSIQQPILCRKRNKTSHQSPVNTTTNILQKEEQDQPPVTSIQQPILCRKRSKTSNQTPIINIVQE